MQAAVALRFRCPRDDGQCDARRLRPSGRVVRLVTVRRGGLDRSAPEK